MMLTMTTMVVVVMMLMRMMRMGRRQRRRRTRRRKLRRQRAGAWVIPPFASWERLAHRGGCESRRSSWQKCSFSKDS
eukprot:9479574-Pyramimonas_sp.AAC.1